MGTLDGEGGQQTISRRGFLAGAATVAAVAVLPVSLAQTAAAATVAKAPANLTRSTFTPLVGSSFRMVGTGGTSVTVVLSAINDLLASPAGSENQFSLMFDGPTKSAQPQATYSFRNSHLANVNLFAVPVDQPQTSQHYQVIIYSS
jgi:secreted PhoX family phosphatase